MSSSTTTRPKVFSVYAGNVVGSCWDMTITVYLLDKARLPDNIDIEMLFESVPNTGFHFGRMKYHDRYYDVLAKVEDIYGCSCERPLHFLCTVDKKSATEEEGSDMKQNLTDFRSIL